MNNVKLAISNIAWDKIDDKEMYTFLQSEKIKGIEIAPTRIFEEKPYDRLDEASEYSKYLQKEYDLTICSIQSIWYGQSENIFENENSRKKLLDYTKKAIDFAKSINCRNLVFGCPKNRNMTNKEVDYEIALSFFKEIGKYALEKEVVIAIEPNPTIYNTNFLNATIEAIEFVKDLNLESIKINYDLGTVIYNDESLNILKDNLNYISHIHISEPNLDIIKSRPLHNELFNILKNSKYEHFVSIEMKKSELDIVKKILKYVIEIRG